MIPAQLDVLHESSGSHAVEGLDQVEEQCGAGHVVRVHIHVSSIGLQVVDGVESRASLAEAKLQRMEDMCLVSRREESGRWMRCSNVRMRMDVMEMGRNEAGSARLPLPFHSAMTLASVHCRGSTRVLPGVREYTAESARYAVTHQHDEGAWGGMVSQPGAELVCCVLHCCLTSSCCERPAVTDVRRASAEGSVVGR